MIVHYVVVGIQRWRVSGSFFSCDTKQSNVFHWKCKLVFHNKPSFFTFFHSFTSKTYTDLNLTEISELMNSNAFATLPTPIDI